jgi:hypothetical protein
MQSGPAGLVELGDGFDPVHGVGFAAAGEARYLMGDPPPDGRRARIRQHQAQLAKSARAPPLAHGLHSLRRRCHFDVSLE